MTLLGTLPRCHETTAQQTVRLFFGKLATSLRRNEVLRKHTPRHQVVLIALHAGHGDVGGSPAERPVQPNGNVAQGGSLYLRDGARIPKSHREGRDSAVLLMSSVHKWTANGLPVTVVTWRHMLVES